LAISKQKSKRGSVMKRREFLKTAGAGLAASTAVAAPAIAQSIPELKWRCTTSWPKSLDVPYSASETISKYVAEATDHNSRFRLLPPARSFLPCRWSMR
jgi:TRAP-type mannitol/chloroaromatic compound transport system substrate-binding protein